MSKLTHNKKKAKIKQLQSWISSYENKVFRLKNIKIIVPLEIEKCNIEIDIFRKNLFDWYKEYKKSNVPTLINGQLLEQSNFINEIEAAKYISEVLEKSYDVITSGNNFINMLIHRTYLEIEVLSDNSIEIKNLQSKLDKHNTTLKKIQNTISFSRDKIENGFKIKEDFSIIIKNIEQSLNKRTKILRNHLYHLDEIRMNTHVNQQILSGAYNGTELFKDTLNFEKFKVRIFRSVTLENKIKVRKWIKNNICEIRQLKVKLVKFQQEYEEYLLQIGSQGEKEIRYFFMNNNIQFEEQKRFETCFDKAMLPFDFLT